jgi:hypothetical protein
MLVILIFILLVQRNLQGIPSLKEKAFLQGCEKFGRYQKIRYAMICERKGWEECQNFKRKENMRTTY